MSRFETWKPKLQPKKGGPILLKGIDMHLDFKWDDVVPHGRSMFNHCSYLANLAHVRCGGKTPALILTDNDKEIEGEDSNDTHHFLIVNLRRYIKESTGDPAVSYLARRTDVYKASLARLEELMADPALLNDVMTAEQVADWLTVDPARSDEVREALDSEQEVPNVTQARMVTAFNRYWQALTNNPALRDAVFSNEEIGASEAFAQWVAERPDQATLAFQAVNEGDLAAINAAAGVARLRRFVEEWEANRSNAKEEYWQDLLTRESWVLAQLFGAPFVIVKGKAYVGGKTYENLEGRVTDFLYKNRLTGNVAIIEIKTPCGDLLGSKYRNQVYPPSTELTGATTQVLDQRNLLCEEYRDLKLDTSAGAVPFNPRAVVLIGDIETQGVTGEKLRSFELFRNEMAGVEVVTFDELAAKAEALLELFEASDAEDEAVES
jgi:Shedu protein SduA, C-terminal